jgi:hypothetical protein
MTEKKEKVKCVCGYDKFNLIGFIKMSKNRGDLRELECQRCHKIKTI